MKTIFGRRTRAVALLAVMLTLAGGVAEARMGGGRGSFGSRGARTWSAPPTTSTAPGTAAPMQRSQAPNVGPTGSIGSPSAAQPRRFGFGTGIAAGLLGAGLIGMLTGHGFFGGLAGLGSVLGLLLQIGLVAWLVSFAIRWFRRRQEQQQPAYAYARSATGGSGRPGPQPAPQPTPSPSPLFAGLGGSARQQTRPARPGVRDEIGIVEKDYEAFERTLVDTQTAYSRSDIATLWDLATPEMAGYLQEELSDHASQGVVNTVSDVRLLQGDLAEAWREGGADYATVAMRYGLIDVTKEKATGRVVDGDPSNPVETTEIWTFRREPNGPWKLSALQQVQ